MNKGQNKNRSTLVIDDPLLPILSSGEFVVNQKALIDGQKASLELFSRKTGVDQRFVGKGKEPVSIVIQSRVHTDDLMKG